MNKIREDISQWPIEKRAKKLQEIFLQRMGYPLDLRNPKSFSEMQQWCKLYYHDPRITQCVDKVTFKEYVRSILGGDKWTAKLYKVWHRAEDVSLEDLPEQFVIKSNCSSDGHNLVVVTDKRKRNLLALEAEIKTGWFDRLALHTNSFASYYYPVQPAVLAEEYLPASNEMQNEYKIMCFHGEPYCVTVPGYAWRDGQKDKFVSCSFYTLEWKCLPVRYGHKDYCAGLPRPKRLPEMLEICSKLSSDFPCVRVDFMEAKEKLYLTELSFGQGGGWEAYEPHEFDFELGKKMDIKRWANPIYIDSAAPV